MTLELMTTYDYAPKTFVDQQARLMSHLGVADASMKRAHNELIEYGELQVAGVLAAALAGLRNARHEIKTRTNWRTAGEKL